MELAPDGAGYRFNTRFARFVNVPELMHLFRSDGRRPDGGHAQAPGARARRRQGAHRPAPATPELKAFVASLAKRAEKLKTENHVDPWEDNMLKITGEGRKAALDLRLGAVRRRITRGQGQPSRPGNLFASGRRPATSG
jgi:N12 class adenine-specific DNA methylase